MADIVQLTDLGDLRLSAIASAFEVITAGGAGNNVQVVGNAVDRLDPKTGALARNAVFSVAWAASLSAGKTLTLSAVEIDHAPDGATWSTFVTVSGTLVVDAATGAGAGTADYPVDLTGAYRYTRIKYTPDLSNTATDTANLVAIATLAGFDRLAA